MDKHIPFRLSTLAGIRPVPRPTLRKPGTNRSATLGKSSAAFRPRRAFTDRPLPERSEFSARAFLQFQVSQRGRLDEFSQVILGPPVVDPGDRLGRGCHHIRPATGESPDPAGLGPRVEKSHTAAQPPRRATDRRPPRPATAGRRKRKSVGPGVHTRRPSGHPRALRSAGRTFRASTSAERPAIEHQTRPTLRAQRAIDRPLHAAAELPPLAAVRIAAGTAPSGATPVRSTASLSAQSGHAASGMVEHVQRPARQHDACSGKADAPQQAEASTAGLPDVAAGRCETTSMKLVEHHLPRPPQ